MIRAAWKEVGLFLNLGQCTRRETHTDLPIPSPDGSDKHRCRIKVGGKRLELPFPAPTALPTLRQVQSSTGIATLSPTLILPKPDSDILRAMARKKDRSLLSTEQVTLQQLCNKYRKQRPRKLTGLPEAKEQGSDRSPRAIPHREVVDPDTAREAVSQLFAFVGEFHRKIPFYLGLGTFSEDMQEVEFQYLGFAGQGKNDPFNADYKLAWLDPGDGKTVYAKSRPGKQYPDIEPCMDTCPFETDVLTR
jgi:hypothetical protein